MDLTLREHRTYLSQPSWRNRLVSFLLAAAVTALIALLMLAMGALGPGDKTKTTANLVAVQLPPERSGSKATPRRTVTRQAAAAPHPQQAVLQRAPVIKPPVPMTPFLHLSKEEFAASDISKLPSHSGEGSTGTGASGGSSTYGPGEGPGGEQLYNVEWYREPTDAELAPYMAQATGEVERADIACRMIEHYHVENCQELSESPPGSGAARALRRAAWQFLVRPPRVGDHVMIGSWVRITFTFRKRAGSEPVEAVPGADNGP